MPDAAEIRRNLTGAWQLMMGRPDGMRLLDTSIEGFWDSFFAIAFAAPALAVGWIAGANDFQQMVVGGSRVSTIVRLAFIDLAVWILPLVALALVVKRAGIADRFVPYVVSANWASVLLVWMMLPPSLLRLVAPEAGDLASTLAVLLFMVSLVLSWRQTNAALNKGPAVATALFVGMFLCALAVLVVLQAAFGLHVPEQMPG
ncbi:transporter [Arvimicrobium flavum]|uniref:transporter n=1 Tax=Arvimicrobium flavum TaxID=3393320 RepID=UPI00237AB545|nr:transporter [Mesorhizobium shangrilense]